LAFAAAPASGFEKQRFIELGIHHDFINRDFLRRNGRPSTPASFGPPAELSSPEQTEPEGRFRPIIAIVDFDWMVYAIKPPGLPFDFASKKVERVYKLSDMDRRQLIHV